MLRILFVFFVLTAASPCIPAHAQTNAPEEDVAIAEKLAQEKQSQFSLKHPENIMEKGALNFKTWQGFYTFIARLHHIEPTPNNLLGLASWSTLYWQYHPLIGQWYFVIKVDFDQNNSGKGSILGQYRETTHFIVFVNKQGLRMIGAFSGNTYELRGVENGMPIIVPFTPSEKDPNCCYTTPLAWDNIVYRLSTPTTTQ